MKKAVIFDLNGVFLISEPLSRRFEKKYGVPEKVFWSIFKEILSKVRQPEALSTYELLWPYLNQWQVELSAKEFYDFWFAGEALDEKMIQMVKKLKASDWKVFILSNNLKERSIYYRQTVPELQLFDKIYFSWETGFIKPDKRCFELIFKENDLLPSQCYYFDDSSNNVQVAKDLGVNAFVFESVGQVETILLDVKNKN